MMLKYISMKYITKLMNKLDEDIETKALFKIVLILLIVFLIKETDIVWKGLFYKVWNIIEPFVYGFAIAYVVHPLLLFLEKKSISRKVSIPILYVVICIVFLWLIFTIFPMIFSRLSGLFTSMASGLTNLYMLYTEASESSAPIWVQEAIKEFVLILNNTKDIVSTNVDITKVFSSTISIVTRTIITLIISIYMCYDWDKIKKAIYHFSERYSTRAPQYIHAISSEVSDYISSLIILMLIKLVEYSILYLALGQKDWMIIALLYALGLIVPYLGGTIANIVGILTSLTLSMNKVVILLVMIVILSNVDAYIIGPMVHSRNVKISPLMALFSIIAGGSLFGAIGIMIGIPIFLAIRTIIQFDNNTYEMKGDNR